MSPERPQAPEPYERSGAAKSRWRALLSLTHPRGVFIPTLAVPLMALIALGDWPEIGLLLRLMLVMAGIQVVSGLVNEIYDFELDRETKPWRALPAGQVSLSTARWLAIGCGLLALTLAATISPASFFLLALGLGMTVLYSARLKRSVWSWLPYAAAYPLQPVWVWVSLGLITPWLATIYLVGVPLAIGVHLVNQLRDYDEDEAMGIRSLVHRLGKDEAGKTTFILLLSPIITPAGLLLLNSLEIAYPLWPFLLLTLILVLHLLLVILPLGRSLSEFSPDLHRHLFRRLQLTVPLLLLSWLLAFRQLFLLKT